jgi:hypothetical protein
MLKTIQLLKRNDDQAEGTVTSYILWEVRRGQIFKTDEPILHDMSASYRTTFHIPRITLEYVGVTYINALDRIVELSDQRVVLRIWQPEATTQITEKLFENHYCVDCLLLQGNPV